MNSNLLDEHYKSVIRYITHGRVVPFLGAGANLCDRPQDATWCGHYLPSGGELSTYLAENFDYPSNEIRFICPSCKSEVGINDNREKQDLLRVSQYITVRDGSAPLYLELHGLLDSDYPITSLHKFIATLPGTLREKGYPYPYQLIVTTNYDDVLERAFNAEGEKFDIIYYEADGEHRGRFWHRPPDAEPRIIERPNEYSDLSLEERTIILKIHGAIDRSNPKQDSYVITEDHYIDYLTRTDISNLVPVEIAAKLRNSHFLFMGYSLRDWNLRVILQRIWGEQKLTFKSWAIQINPQPVDEKFWGKRDVDLLGMRLEGYIAGLSERVRALPKR